MASIIQGTKQDPTRVDVQQAADDKWIMGVDLENLPPETPIKAVRRTFSLQATRKYVYRTEYIDRSNGTTKEVISRAITPDADSEINQVNTLGLVDSPLSVELWDITP